MRIAQVGNVHCSNMIDLNTLQLPELFDTLVRNEALDALIATERDEDLGDAGDITSKSLIDPSQQCQAILLAKANGVVAGLEVIPDLQKQFHTSIAWDVHTSDGQSCVSGDTLAVAHGSMRELLVVERTLLNMLCHLSGIATLTRQYVAKVTGTHAVICDTRKTHPGYRALEKYAVRCGGGTMHRIGLFDAALFKDNHLTLLPTGQLAEKLQTAIRSIRQEHDTQFIEVEVDTLEQLQIVLSLPESLIDIVLLDNMNVGKIREAVTLRDQLAPGVLLEASGGIGLETVRDIAESGVNRIAVGALTHSAPALDLGLEIISEDVHDASG